MSEPRWLDDDEQATWRAYLLTTQLVDEALDRQLQRDALTAAIPVVLITLKGTDTDLFWGRKQGADDHIVKPFTADQVKRAIERFVGAA